MKRFIKHITVFIFVTFIALQLVSLLSLYFLRQSHFYKPQFVANTLRDVQLDYVVLGSSTGLTTLNTEQIDNETGLKGFNISVDDTSLSTHYLMLQHFIENEGSARSLVLVVSPGDLANGDPSISGNDYRFLPYAHKRYVNRHYVDMPSREAAILKVSKYMPFIGVSYYNAELFYPSLKAAIQPGTRNRFDKNGNYVYPTNGIAIEKTMRTKELYLTIANPYFEKIKALCDKEQIKLVVYQPPIYGSEVLGETGLLPFVNHSNLLTDPLLFYDRIHVNRKGRIAASRAFALQLKNL